MYVPLEKLRLTERKNELSKNTNSDAMEVDEEVDMSGIKYQSSWEKNIKDHQPTKISVADFQSHKDWIEYMFNKNNPHLSTYTCKYCSRYAEPWKIQSRNPGKLTKKEGDLKDTWTENAQLMNKHETSQTHVAVMQTVEDIKVQNMNKMKFVENPVYKGMDTFYENQLFKNSMQRTYRQGCQKLFSISRTNLQSC